MRLQIVSNYPYEVVYGDLAEPVKLAPGENLVEAEIWQELIKASSRLSNQMLIERIVNAGWYVELFVDKLIGGESVDPNTLMTDEAETLVKEITDKALLADLAARATRGGVKRAFERAANA